MAFYEPTVIPAGLQSIDDLKSFLNNEFQKIKQSRTNADQILKLDRVYELPKKYEDGTIIYADSSVGLGGGTTGVYRYSGSAWVLLG